MIILIKHYQKKRKYLQVILKGKIDSSTNHFETQESKIKNGTFSLISLPQKTFLLLLFSCYLNFNTLPLFEQKK